MISTIATAPATFTDIVATSTIVLDGNQLIVQIIITVCLFGVGFQLGAAYVRFFDRRV